MSWNCPDCGSNENEGSRCVCGYEPPAEKPLTIMHPPAGKKSQRPPKNFKVTLLLLKLYLITSILIFIAGYYLLQIREMGLYLFMLFINLPATVVTIGMSEEIASRIGESLGSQRHILILEVISLTANILLLTVISGIIEFFVKQKKRRND